MRRLTLLAALSTAACTVVDAPTEVEDLVVFGFEHFEDPPRFLEAVHFGLAPWVDDHFDEMVDGWRVNNLTEAHLEAAGVEDPELDDVLGAIAAADYRHTVEDVVPLLAHPEKDELYEQVIDFQILEDTDLDCFLAHECETYTYTARQTVRVALLGESTQTFDQVLRWVTTEAGETFVVGRTLSPTPVEFSTSIVAVDQQYALFLVYPWEGAARRAEAYWVESRIIGADVPDTFAVSQAARQIVTQAERVDDAIDALAGG